MKTTWIPRAGVIMTVLLLGSTLAQAQGTQLLVSNVQAQQRPFTATWDVTYDLETVGDMAVTVSLYLSTDSGASYPNLCGTVSGDVGAGVLPGIGKSIVWDAGADFPGLSSATCRLRVTADDGQSEVPAGFVAITPGTFMMGSPTTEPGRAGGETQHQVTLTHGFYMQATEVTNQQYRDLVQWAYDNGYVTATSASVRDALDGSTQELLDLDGYREISFSGGTFTVDAGKANHPVLQVTWYGSVAYCDWLSLQQGLPRAYSHSTWQCNAGNPYTAPGYRLPTEAEWEYACRAGTQTPFNTGSCLDAGTEANYYGSYPYTGCPAGPYVGWTVPVGSYPANAFGLYDMHGNLWEWCNDGYGTYGGTVTDPVGAGAGNARVFRGGSWGSVAQDCRSAYRNACDPYYYSPFGVGFRPVRSAF
ncbi:MAG: formylglycine-generating enzyme family protein [bacterium]|nr:formylglycine-generating enzyme family protein [bacterium]